MHGGLGTFLFGSHLWHVIAANKKICSPLQDFETEYLYILNPKTVPADRPLSNCSTYQANEGPLSILFNIQVNNDLEK